MEDARDSLLFTPGPLTTSRTVKQAMLRDAGSRDAAFLAVVARIRQHLTELAGGTADAYATVPMQGSGTFAMEAVLSSTIPRDGAVLVAVNGAYGARMVRICAVHGIPVRTVMFEEDEPVDPDRVVEAVRDWPEVTHVAAVHCETTSGIVNPVGDIGRMVAETGRVYILDAMSSFGALDVSVERDRVDFLVSSANKCLEGVPGLAFVVARRSQLVEIRGRARTLSLDLHDQYAGLEANGQFRFTPPTHVIFALDRALRELEAEGGPAGRRARYAANHRILMEGMTAMGFRPLLPPEWQSPIITSFRYPADEAFDFERFYRGIAELGFLIYPGKVGKADCFRIGTIGRITPGDIRMLLLVIRKVLTDMGVVIPVGD